MRFLKNKIALASQTHSPESLEEPKVEPNVKQEASSPKFVEKLQSNRGRRRKEHNNGTEDVKSTKTVVKNYGKAIASFAISPIAIPYLNPLVKQEGISVNEFVKFISTAKEGIEGIETFRALLLVKEGDDKKTAAYKRVFQSIGEIFIKSFSVNWIFSGRMANKQAHLKFRFKMLRRIKSPELFTYLK